MRRASERTQIRVVNHDRLERHYTLPIGNIRVLDKGVRELFTSIEDAIQHRYGIRPSRTDVLMAALRAYHRTIQKG